MPTYLLKTAIKFNHPDTPAFTERLVEAKNQAQAIRHVTSDTITCEVVEIADAMRLAAAGVKLEKATEQ